MKKVVLGLCALVMVASGVAMVSAYEAHIINVTAHVENAMRVPVTPLNFGTVFPEEWLIKTISVGTSGSFCADNQTRVTKIDYALWVEWKEDAGRDFAWWDGDEWVADTDFYNWLGYFTYVGIDAAIKKPAGAGGNLVLVGDPPEELGVPATPGTKAKFVLASPIPLHKYAPYNLNDDITVALDVPVFEGFYNPLTDPEPKPSGLDDPSWLVPEGMPGFDETGMDFGLDLKIQVTNIYN